MLKEEPPVEGEELHDKDGEAPALPALVGVPREVPVSDGAPVRHEPVALDEDGRVERQQVVEEEVQVAVWGDRVVGVDGQDPSSRHACIDQAS